MYHLVIFNEGYFHFGFLESFFTRDLFHLIGNGYNIAHYEISAYKISMPRTNHAPLSENHVSASGLFQFTVCRSSEHP